MKAAILVLALAAAGCGAPRALRTAVPFEEAPVALEITGCGRDRSCTAIHSEGDATLREFMEVLGCNGDRYCGIIDDRTVVLYKAR